VSVKTFTFIREEYTKRWSTTIHINIWQKLLQVIESVAPGEFESGGGGTRPVRSDWKKICHAPPPFWLYEYN